MRILALEFSSARRSVAVLTASGEVATNTEDQGESTGAFALIEQALNKARMDRSSIDCVAVGLGPGSYTGIRVAISIAQGWHLAKGVKLLGISSADALAEAVRAHGLTGNVTCAIDAQRNEFYVCAYNLDTTPATVIQALHIESEGQVMERATKGETLVGPQQALSGNQILFPDARALARLAARRSDFIRGEQLEPIYLRETTFVKAPPARFSSAAA